MGSIILNNLKNTGKNTKGYTYVDLNLDISEHMVPTILTNTTIQGKDIEVDYDIAAINNSLLNIFNTTPGERFLVPRFGANLRRYLFAPVSEAIGHRIGSEILRAIEEWEPRVVVDRINVTGYPDNASVSQLDAHQYDVEIQITILGLKEKVSFTGVLTQDSDRLITNLSRVCPV